VVPLASRGWMRGQWAAGRAAHAMLEDVAFGCGNRWHLNGFARIEVVPRQPWTIVRG
jgi:hypothetical protein